MLAIFLALGLFARTIATTDIHRVGKLVSQVGPAALLAFIPAALLLLSETFSWSRLYRFLGRAPSFFGLLRIRTASEAVTLSVPAGALASEPFKVILARSKLGIPESTTTATLASRAPLEVVSIATYILVGVALNAIERGDMLVLGQKGLSYLLLGVAALLLLVAAALAFAMRGSLAERFYRLLMRIPIDRVRNALARRRHSFSGADVEVLKIGSRYPSVLAQAGLPILTGLFAQALETWLMLRLLGVSMPFGEVVCLDASIALVRSIAFVLPAGIGLTDLTYVAAFNALGIPDATTLGAAFAVLKRSRDIVVIATGYAFLFLARRNQVDPRAPHMWQKRPVFAEPSPNS